MMRAEATTTSRRDAILFGCGMAMLAALPGSLSAETPMSQVDPRRNKALIATFIDRVWRQGQLDQLSAFWTADCVNHADLASPNRGLPALRRYHEQFGQAFVGFSSPAIEIVQQIAEDDRVVSQLVTRATHIATGKPVSLATIRIDRIETGKIAEHWSVADMAGLMRQLNG